MVEAFVTAVTITAIVGFVGALFIPRLGKPILQSEPGVVRRSGRGTMKRIAGWIVMGLGHLTITALHLFERLGVFTMAETNAFDEALARLTTFTSAQATSLREARDTNAAQASEIERLITTDAEEDRRQIAEAVAAALAEAASKVDAVIDNLENPPGETVPPVVEEPTPSDPETPGVPGDLPNEVPEPVPGDPANIPPESVPDPVVVTPVEPEPEAPVVEVPIVVEPGADPVPAGDLPTDTPVVEAPAGPVDEVPADAEVVLAGDLPAETPVVEVAEDDAAE